jgi:hypothetical protein
MPSENGNQEQKLETTELVPVVEHSLAGELARAEIDQQIATARRYPRSFSLVKKNVEFLATHDEAAAENCIYSLPRGGKPIIGPSIGFANVLTQSWGNCLSKGVILGADIKRKVVIAEGSFHDYESNQKVVVTEERRIVDKTGRIFNDDMITITGKAAASIARRNAALNAIPRPFWHPTFERCLEIVRGTMETFSERKDKALKAFAQFGVKPAQIYGILRLEDEADLTLEHIPVLRGMYAALREGSTTVEEMFDPRLMKGQHFETVANPLKDEPEKKPKGRPRKAKEAAAESTSIIQDIPFKESTEETHTYVQQNPIPEVPAEPEPPDCPPGTIPFKQLPRTAAEYHAHLAIWLSMVTLPADVQTQWNAERKLRGDCGVIGEEMDAASAAKEARLKELGLP